jgi:hypothetical protein
VEVDQTYWGRDPDAKPSGTPIHEMMKVLSLVDRASGGARSFVMNDLTTASVPPILEANLSYEARLMTDEAPRYKAVAVFADHGTVNHSKDEYVSNQDPTVHTNTVESFFSVWKRGMRGTYQHCSKNHLHRCAAEFDFRYTNRVRLGVDDVTRAEMALARAWGRRLTYQTTREQAPD